MVRQRVSRPRVAAWTGGNEWLVRLASIGAMTLICVPALTFGGRFFVVGRLIVCWEERRTGRSA